MAFTVHVAFRLPLRLSSSFKSTNVICKCQIKPFIITAIFSGTFFFCSLGQITISHRLETWLIFQQNAMCVWWKHTYTTPNTNTIWQKEKYADMNLPLTSKRIFKSKPRFMIWHWVCMSLLITTVSYSLMLNGESRNTHASIHRKKESKKKKLT